MLDIYTFVLKSHWFKCTHNMRWCRVSNSLSQWFEFFQTWGGLIISRRLRACQVVGWGGMVRYASGIVIAAIPMKLLTAVWVFEMYLHFDRRCRTGFLILRAADLGASAVCSKSGYLSCIPYNFLKVFEARSTVMSCQDQKKNSK